LSLRGIRAAGDLIDAALWTWTSARCQPNFWIQKFSVECVPMPVKSVPVSKIRPNPFLARRSINHDSIKIRELADSIKALGLLNPLRGRERNGHVELCSGHRRLEAIRMLRWKSVEVDVVELSNVRMAADSLAENFQREDLDPVEKAEGVDRLIKLLMEEEGLNRARARAQVTKMLGLSNARISEILKVATKLEEPVKEQIRLGNIAETTAVEAHRFGGTDFAIKAIQDNIRPTTIRAMNVALRQIPDPTIREEIVKQEIAGKLEPSGKAIKTRARFLLAKKKGQLPDNLRGIMSKWTTRLNDWKKELKELAAYRDYIDARPTDAKRLRDAAGSLIDDLQTFLD
jgi:ParB/RepB/Spo0J family partition protein